MIGSKWNYDWCILIAEIIICTSISDYILLFRLMGTRNPYGLSSTMYFPFPAANQSSCYINLKERIVHSFICWLANSFISSTHVYRGPIICQTWVKHWQYKDESDVVTVPEELSVSQERRPPSCEDIVGSLAEVWGGVTEFFLEDSGEATIKIWKLNHQGQSWSLSSTQVWKRTYQMVRTSWEKLEKPGNTQ